MFSNNTLKKCIHTVSQDLPLWGKDRGIVESSKPVCVRTITVKT